ncbi:hypothetical protein LguiA_025750 [Lonicera macranthoides]
MLLLAGSLPHYSLRDLAEKYGPIMHLQLGEISAIVISSPQLAKEVMKTHDLAFASSPRILASEILTYNYTNIGTAPYGEYWRQKKSGHFALSGRMRATFGARFKDEDSLIKLLKEAVSLGGGFDVADLFPSFKFLRVIFGLRPKLEKLQRKLDQIYDSIFDECIKNSKGGNTADPGEENLLQILLRIKDGGGHEFPITLDNVKAVLLDMFSAGTDTSSTTIIWAMAEMMRHPRVMEKEQAELTEALNGKEVMHETDIQEQSYLKMVIKETLRSLVLWLPNRSKLFLDISWYPARHLPVPAVVGLPFIHLVTRTNKLAKSYDMQLVAQMCKIPEAQLNYPSFLLKLTSGSQTYTRIVTNVGLANSSYTVRVYVASQVNVVVVPNRLEFTKVTQQLIYRVTFSQSVKKPLISHGYLTWTSARHIVRSQITITLADLDHWDEPDSFKPERFINSSQADIVGTNYEYLPFGAGRRMCPRSIFGLANVELSLPQLLYHFNWKLPHGMSSGDLDMSETLGATSARRNNLYLVATPHTHLE